MMRSAIGTYYAVYFGDVASAVAYCHSLVPFIVPRGRMLVSEAHRPVVWFHVPPRSTASATNGCYLFASEGALAAARHGNARWTGPTAGDASCRARSLSIL